MLAALCAVEQLFQVISIDTLTSARQPHVLAVSGCAVDTTMPKNAPPAQEIPVDDDILDLLEIVKPGKPMSPEKAPSADDDFSAGLDAMLDDLARKEQEPFPDPTPVDREVDVNEELALPNMNDIEDLLQSIGAKTDEQKEETEEENEEEEQGEQDTPLESAVTMGDSLDLGDPAFLPDMPTLDPDAVNRKDTRDGMAAALSQALEALDMPKQGTAPEPESLVDELLAPTAPESTPADDLLEGLLPDAEPSPSTPADDLLNELLAATEAAIPSAPPVDPLHDADLVPMPAGNAGADVPASLSDPLDIEPPKPVAQTRNEIPLDYDDLPIMPSGVVQPSPVTDVAALVDEAPAPVMPEEPVMATESVAPVYPEPSPVEPAPSDEQDELAPPTALEALDLNELDSLIDGMLATAPAPGGMAFAPELPENDALPDAGLSEEYAKKILDLDALATTQAESIAALETQVAKQMEDVANLAELLQKQGEEIDGLEALVKAQTGRIDELEHSMEKLAAAAAAKVIREEITALLAVGLE